MNEIFIAYIGLGLITSVQFIIVVNRLDGLEQKINKLKAEIEAQGSEG